MSRRGRVHVTPGIPIPVSDRMITPAVPPPSPTWCPSCGRVFAREPVGAWCRHLDWTFVTAARRLEPLPTYHPLSR